MTIKTPVITTLSASYQAITLPSADRRSFSAQTSDGTSFYVAVDASGTGEALVESGAQTINRMSSNDDTIFWAKAFSGTPDLTVFWG